MDTWFEEEHFIVIRIILAICYAIKISSGRDTATSIDAHAWILVESPLETLHEMKEAMSMDRTQLAATVDQLSEDERSYLSAYLKMKERISDASYAREMSSRLKAMRSGREVQRNEVLDLHNRLSESGL